jgi:rhodanese-related sulfurtransferase
LDARPAADYAAGHIAHALSLPAEKFDTRYEQIAPMLAPDASIVCYCDGMECDLSHELAELLRERGYTNVHILVNGWTVWSKAGLPTRRGTEP